MNPEDNNLNPNPGTPGAGMTNEPLGAGGLTMADGLASAQDNLTSAGLAASTGEGVMDLNQLGATAPEAVMTPPIDEPLIPAAPVPGSIGSVTSVPPVNTDPMAGAMPTESTVTAGAVPVAEPAPAPYNPFAQTTTAAHTAPAPEPTAAGITPNPTFQPAVPPKAKMKLSPLMLALCAVSGILLIATIVLAVLLVNANNNPKIVYVPQTPNEESNARIEMLTCSRESDFAGYAGTEEPAMGSETITASYTNNELRAVTMEYAMRFADEGAASVAQANFVAEQAELLSSISNSFAVDYDLNGSNLDITIASGRDAFAETDASTLMYGLGNGNSSVSLDSVRNLYESAGFICSVE
mgnify:CR=1 FL=1|jgi:hypothetical protein